MTENLFFDWRDVLMNIRLKLEQKEGLDQELINIIDDGSECICKLTTNVLRISKDKKDERFISSIDSVKMIVKMDDGCVILFGNLQRQFRQPWGGAFYVYKIIEDLTCDFDETLGVDANITFCNNPTDNNAMIPILETIVNHKEFVFRMSQFDDFMEMFGYYKTLSDELNNSATFEIIKRSRPYFFVSVSEKRLYDNDANLLDEYKAFVPIENSNGIIIGYEIMEYDYEILPNAIKNNVKELVDLEIEHKDNKLRKVFGMIDNLYISNHKEINHRFSNDIQHLNVFNVVSDKTTIYLSVENDEKMDYKFLNLYDMGQKIKVDSIDNSLRLIKQGNSGSAIQMISYLIGDTPMPNTGKNNMKKTEKYISNLNESQKQAFLKAIDGSSVTLIKGPPGTGKTHVINAISQYITKELNEKVVISSQTHVAIDNVLDKLMENHDIVVPNRITNRRNKYSGNEIDKTLFNTWGKKFDKHNELASNKNFAKKILDDIAKFKGDERIRFSENIDVSDYSVIGATTTTSAIAGKKGIELLKEYQWLIIDEVSKCPITEVLRYLPYIDRIIMVGDDYQLSPLLEFRKEDVEHLSSYDEEMYERLEDMYQKSVFADTIDKAKESGRLVELNINYRSVPDVLNAYNIFYNYNLDSERLNVNPDKVEFGEKLDYLNKNDIAFVYVRGGTETTDPRTKSRFNVEEINATRTVLRSLIANTKDPHKVSVAAIFPYGAQISRFTKENRELINKAKKVFSTFDVDTVDAFQGKESDIVLVNTVIVESNRRNFLEDFRRINVSMSRAKDKLIIFGNANTLSRLDMNVYDGTKRKYFRDILKEIRQNGIMMYYTSEGGIQIESDSKTKTKTKKAKQ